MGLAADLLATPCARRRASRAAIACARVSADLLTLLLSFACAFVSAPVRAEGPELVLQQGSDYYEPVLELRYWVDHAGEAGPAGARAALAQGAFEPVPGWPPVFGFGSGDHWFQLSIRNAGHVESDWNVAISYALLDHIELYELEPARTTLRAETGDTVPFVQRALADRHPSFQVRLESGSRHDFLIRVRTTSSVQVPVVVATSRALLERSHEAQLVLGLYYGIMLGLFLYNLVLFVSLRDRTFLYYIVYVALFAMGQFTLNGLAFEYFWPGDPGWANTAVLVFIGLGLVAMLQFTRTFLELRRQAPHMDESFAVMAVVLLLVVAINPWLGYRHTIFIETGFVFLMVIAIFTAAIRVYRRGYRPARNYLIAWTALLLGVFAFASVSFGLLPKVFLTEYGIQIGSAAEMVLLSFALADRVHVLREENARLQRETAERLEARVQERTQALNAALAQLQQANRVLNEFSLRDGLTGTYNRRYLDRALEDLHAEGRRRNTPLSVLMVDLDHFKMINDTRGHLFGDDCLIAVAHVLTAGLCASEERVARFGGEEFAVLLPGLPIADAMHRAESMRQAIERLVVESAEQRVSVTASFGVAALSEESGETGADVLRRADRALYEAKRRGRNCVVAAGPDASGAYGFQQLAITD